MGIYWCAMDHNRKLKFESPLHFGIKTPGIFHPTTPFPGMFVMKNSQYFDFELVNDCSEEIYYADGYKDITEEVYKEYLEYFPWAKDEIYEPKEN